MEEEEFEWIHSPEPAETQSWNIIRDLAAGKMTVPADVTAGHTQTGTTHAGGTHRGSGLQPATELDPPGVLLEELELGPVLTQEVKESAGVPENKETPKKLRLMLVGKTGSGKSATGNSILGCRMFESKLSAVPVTRTFQKGNRYWAGKELEVMDTPDLLCPLDPPAQLMCEAITLSSPGPHVVLLVTQLGRFTEQDRQVALRLQQLFGVGVLAHTILVFTRKEDLGDGSLDEYLRHTENRDLAKLDALCAWRHCGFNNRAQDTEQKDQLQELMKQVEIVLWEHEGRCYQNSMYLYSQQRGSQEELEDKACIEELCRVQKESEESHKCVLGKARL